MDFIQHNLSRTLIHYSSVGILCYAGRDNRNTQDNTARSETVQLSFFVPDSPLSRLILSEEFVFSLLGSLFFLSEEKK